MGFKMKTVFDITDKMAKAAKGMDGVNVNAGVLSGDSQWLAGIHEYGCTIPVTDKMRAYLHSIGVHLRETTKQIVIPERSFLRAGYDQHRADILRQADRLVAEVLAGTMTPEQYLEKVGAEMRDYIKEYAFDLQDPPKQEWPTRDPGKNNPLYLSGDLIGGIEYEIERR